MTLKEKFIDAFKSGKRFDIQNAETIADEFAVEFAEWLETDWTCDERWTIIVDKRELLEIFKKEKGL